MATSSKPTSPTWAWLRWATTAAQPKQSPCCPVATAIGAGTAVNGVTTDQRGEPLDKPSPDIGAFRSQGFTLTPVAGSTPQSTNPGSGFANARAVTVTANQPRRSGGRGLGDLHRPRPAAPLQTCGGGVYTIVEQGTVEIAGTSATANNVAGSYVVTVSTPGALPVNFQLSNLTSNLISLTFSGLSNPSIKYGSSATFAGKLSNGNQAPRARTRASWRRSAASRRTPRSAPAARSP